MFGLRKLKRTAENTGLVIREDRSGFGVAQDGKYVGHAFRKPYGNNADWLLPDVEPRSMVYGCKTPTTQEQKQLLRRAEELGFYTQVFGTGVVFDILHARHRYFPNGVPKQS